jgi:hypothetical protein
LLALVSTLLDIALLRKGPDAIPRSWILLAMAVALWLFSSLAGLALIERIDETDFFLGLFGGLAGIVLYALIVVVSGRGERLIQTIAAIVGCGALIFFIFIAEYVLFTPFVGERITWLVANLILLWSIPVEGHIIARAIDRHWYIGISLAIAVFALQLVMYSFIAQAR